MLYAKPLATLGVGLFALGIVLHLALMVVAWPASQMDSTMMPPVRGMCSDVLKDIQIQARVMSVADTNILTAILNNPYENICEITTTLRIVDFDTDPEEHSASSTLEPGETKNLDWVIKPKKPGKSDMIFTAGSISKRIGITVLDLPFRISRIMMFEAFTTFVGPMWTLPWLYEHLMKKRGEKKLRRG